MTGNEKQMTVNFLRGVPAEEALQPLVPIVAKGYERVVQKYGTDVLQYGHFMGFERLRKILGDWHNVDPNRVIVGNGGMEMISLFFKSLPLETTIIVEEATYDRVVLDALRYGHRLFGVELTREGVDLDRLKVLIDQTSPAVFYGIPFHQNPTGINYTVENRSAVEALCRENDMLCAWDVCYEDLRYDGTENRPIEVSDWGPVLISSFTKTVSPGTKCGYLVLPADRVDHTANIVANTRINPNLPTQALIADFIESGSYDGFLKQLKALYRPRMDALNSALRAHFADFDPVTITGGFFAALQLKGVSGDREREFLERARAAGVLIAAAWNAIPPNLREKKQKEGLYLRLTFPAAEPDRIRFGIKTLKDVASGF